MSSNVQHRLKDIMEPKAIAVIGASTSPGKIGFEVLRNIVEGKFQGDIYPVNPKGGEVLGLKFYSSVLEVPSTPELAVIITPARVVPKIIEECGVRGVKGAVVISAGFSEVGNFKLEEELVRTARKYNVRIIGPNSAGVVNTERNLYACLEYRVNPGSISLISQSGAIGGVLFSYARASKVGFNKFISCGNSCDVDEVEALEYLASDEGTSVITLYLESLKRGRLFLKVAKRVSSIKPVLVLKGGLSSAGLRAVASHTGSIATSHDIYRGAFKQAKVLQVSSLEELFDAAKALALQPLLSNKRIAIITNSGGPGVLVTDACERNGLMVPEPSEDLKKRLSEILPPICSIKNPIDLTAAANYELYFKVLKVILFSGEFDGVIVIFVPPSFVDSLKIAKAVVDVKRLSNKIPIIACWLYGDMVESAVSFLESNGIPNISSPTRIARVMRLLLDYHVIMSGVKY